MSMKTMFTIKKTFIQLALFAATLGLFTTPAAITARPSLNSHLGRNIMFPALVVFAAGLEISYASYKNGITKSTTKPSLSTIARNIYADLKNQKIWKNRALLAQQLFVKEKSKTLKPLTLKNSLRERPNPASSVAKETPLVTLALALTAGNIAYSVFCGIKNLTNAAMAPAKPRTAKKPTTSPERGEETPSTTETGEAKTNKDDAHTDNDAKKDDSSDAYLTGAQPPRAGAAVDLATPPPSPKEENFENLEVPSALGSLGTQPALTAGAAGMGSSTARASVPLRIDPTPTPPAAPRSSSPSRGERVAHIGRGATPPPDQPKVPATTGPSDVDASHEVAPWGTRDGAAHVGTLNPIIGAHAGLTWAQIASPRATGRGARAPRASTTRQPKQTTGSTALAPHADRGGVAAPRALAAPTPGSTALARHAGSVGVAPPISTSRATSVAVAAPSASTAGQQRPTQPSTALVLHAGSVAVAAPSASATPTAAPARTVEDGHHNPHLTRQQRRALQREQDEAHQAKVAAEAKRAAEIEQQILATATQTVESQLAANTHFTSDAQKQKMIQSELQRLKTATI